MSEDKITVGVSPEGEEYLKAILTETPWFASGLDLYRTAVSVAISHNVVTEPESLGRVTTKYNIGSLDPDRRMFELVRLLEPGEGESKPYEYIERLADAGIKLLHKQLLTERTMLSSVLLGRTGTAESSENDE